MFKNKVLRLVWNLPFNMFTYAVLLILASVMGLVLPAVANVLFYVIGGLLIFVIVAIIVRIIIRRQL